jgi:hypothetical protein
MNEQSHHRDEHRAVTDLTPPERNKFFYGKLMGVHNFEMEQDYFNAKRRLLNRLVIGPGVVCGLGVDLVSLSDGRMGVQVLPGLAIDRCGREIVVSSRSKPVALRKFPEYTAPKGKARESSGRHSRHPGNQGEYEGRHYCEVPFAHVVLCYHECETDPAPAMGGDCETMSLCVSGSIREQYRIEVREGFASRRDGSFPRSIIRNGELNIDAIVDYITNNCRPFPQDCCIPLANVELEDTGSGWEPEIDISIRPIVYTNRLLFHLIGSLVRLEQSEEEADEEAEV